MKLCYALRSRSFLSNLQHISLSRIGTYICTTRKKKYADKARRIRSLLFPDQNTGGSESGHPSSSIYYSEPLIYKNQADDAVGAVSMMFEGSRSSLHI